MDSERGDMPSGAVRRMGIPTRRASTINIPENIEFTIGDDEAVFSFDLLKKILKLRRLFQKSYQLRWQICVAESIWPSV